MMIEAARRTAMPAVQGTLGVPQLALKSGHVFAACASQ
jgi:hypothetical protein